MISKEWHDIKLYLQCLMDLFTEIFNVTITHCVADIHSIISSIFKDAKLHKSWDIFLLCWNRLHPLLVYNSLSELPLHAKMHRQREREKERQTQRARKRAGRRPPEQPAIFPLFPNFQVWLFTSEQTKTQIRSLICWRALFPSLLFFCPPKIRCLALPSHDTPLSCPL